MTIIILYQKHSCTSWNLHLQPSGPQVQRVLLQQARKVDHALSLCGHCNYYNFCNVSFQEDRDALQEESQLRHWTNMEVPKVFMYFFWSLSSCRCRFSEFVDYVLGKDLRYDDEHWSPYYKECTPCHINFTFVGQSTPEKSPRLSVRVVGTYV